MFNFYFLTKFRYNISMNNNLFELTHGRTSVYNLNYHLVWCTKYGATILKGQIEQELKVILEKIAEENGYRVMNMEVEGTQNCVSLLVAAPPKISVSVMVKQLKGTSSIRLFSTHPDLIRNYWEPKLNQSLWAPGYYVESLGTTNSEAIETYIREQLHKKSQK